MRYRPFEWTDSVIGDAALDAIEADAARYNDDHDANAIADHVMASVPDLVEEVRMYRRWRRQVRTNVIACLGPEDAEIQSADFDGDNATCPETPLCRVCLKRRGGDCRCGEHPEPDTRT